ncbi:MAG: twin-arginine translocation pathway signal protein [Pseudomonadota bacterium]
MPSKSRRNFLKIVGGGVITAAGAGTLFAFTRTPHAAIEPWRLAIAPTNEIDVRKVVLSHAILAPNPHNRQPWMVDLVGDNEIDLYCDLNRRLPETDPFDRQITIGLGCFLELADLTARKAGYRMVTKLFPDGEGTPRLDERLVAKITLEPDDSVKADSLFDQIFTRRSNKDPFDTSKTVSVENADAIVSVADSSVMTGHVLDQTQIGRLRELTWDSLDIEMRTYRTAKESIDLMRIGKSEIEANPDGIDLGGAFIETMAALGQLSREKMLEFDSVMFEQSQAAIRPYTQTAMGYVAVKTAGNSRMDQIQAGRNYVRMNLKATELGIAMHPLSQALQEFEEMEPFYMQMRDELGIQNNETLQMFARIGYGETPAPSPRWQYETRIRNNA